MDEFKVTTQRLYVAYLYFKRFNRDGRFTVSDIGNSTERTKLLYWLKKLVNQGWIREDVGGYSCASYRSVWTKLKTHKVKKLRDKRYIFRYTKLDDYKELDFSGFKAHILDQLRRHQAKRLFNQIQYRCESLEAKDEAKKPTLMVQTVAYHLGFKSSMSGSKYRRRYFKVNQGYKLERHLNDKGIECWKYPQGLLLGLSK